MAVVGSSKTRRFVNSIFKVKSLRACQVLMKQFDAFAIHLIELLSSFSLQNRQRSHGFNARRGFCQSVSREAIKPGTHAAPGILPPEAGPTGTQIPPPAR